MRIGWDINSIYISDPDSSKPLDVHYVSPRFPIAPKTFNEYLPARVVRELRDRKIIHGNYHYLSLSV